jgi:hypothetical protein
MAISGALGERKTVELTSSFRGRTVSGWPS